MIKKLIITLTMLLCLTTNIFAGSTPAWSTKDKALLGAGTVLNVVDILQTREAFNNPKFDEGNPILKSLGRDGATVAMLAANVALYLVADKYFEDRTTILAIFGAMKLVVVGRNISVGIKLKF